MAFSTAPTGGLGRRRFRSGGTLADINIIPLVDVVLVLLIIFMLTAHVMEFGLEVDVPKVSQNRTTAREMPVISVTRDGTTYLNDKSVNLNDLSESVHERFANATEVYIKADRGVTWDALAQVVSACGDAKLKVNMVTQPVDLANKK
ncbi:MAG TPA: biopolymer transporter ExbD [Bryobacteraceae bacterium]|nr:biopolymer transporter ExbD [Bryobacteraceae bacterium]